MVQTHNEFTSEKLARDKIGLAPLCLNVVDHADIDNRLSELGKARLTISLRFTTN